MLWFVFVRCIETGDVTAAMIVFPLGITSEIGIAKFIYTCVYRKKVRQLLQQYLEYDSQIPQGSRLSRHLLQALRNVKRRALIYWIFIVSNGTLYILQPLVMPGRVPMEEVFVLYGLEPELETPNYEITYVLCTLGSVCTCYLTSNVAAFLIIVSGYVESQLLALSEEILNVWDDAELEYKVIDNADEEEFENKEKYDAINESVKIRLKDIVKGHTTNINLLLQVEDIYRGAFAFEFCILSVGLIAELLGGLENTYMEVPFAIIQVGMDCLIGQRVMDACDTFESAVYSCKWERFNEANMKTVFMMLMNSQKTLTLTAGGIAVLNFVCLMSVFRSIYSAFTTLQSVM
ncbi:hypothetical protein ABMA27_004730 [Loxostege sticticalis]